MGKRLFDRIKLRLRNTKEAFRKDCKTSSKLAWLRLLDDTSCRLHMSGVSNYFHNKKDAWITDYLRGLTSELIEKYNGFDTAELSKGDAIWVCWWSGEDTAPELVQQCIRSIRKHAGSHRVYIITEENYSEFIDIPPYMLEAVREKRMGLACLADYIRFSLLAKYGGLWLDATIYCNDSVPEEYFEMPVFTCKSEPIPTRYISKYRWTSFCLGGWKNHPLYCYLKEGFEVYWQKNQELVDYLLIDYMINLAYEDIPAIRADLDAVRVNNVRRDDLQAAMNRAAAADEWEQVVQSDTVLYKLSWRETYSLSTQDGAESIYQDFLKRKI